MKKYSIVFDNHCGVCNVGANTLNKFGALNHVQTIQLSEFSENQVACNVDPARACNEMAVISMDDFSVEYGLRGIARIVENKSPFMSKMLNSKLGHVLFDPLYKIFAFNRRIIAPLEVKGKLCKPILNKKYRLILILLAAVFSVLVTYKKGELIHSINFLHFINGGNLLLVTGAGWFITGVLYRKKDKWDYWGHIAVIASAAIFIQFVALCIYKFWPSPYLLLSAMLIGDPLMLFMHIKRMRILGRSQKQTVIWWVILHLTAGGILSLYYFY